MLQFSLAALHYPLPKEALLSADVDFEFGRSCSDAVWTLAFALNKTIEGTPQCIARIRCPWLIICFVADLKRFAMNAIASDLPGSKDILEVITRKLNSTNFTGLSVAIVYFLNDSSLIL